MSSESGLYHCTPFVDSFDERLWAIGSLPNEELELPCLITDARLRQCGLLQAGKSVNPVVVTHFRDSKRSWMEAKLHTDFMAAKVL